jgi:spectinomycin phosphotransferase
MLEKPDISIKSLASCLQADYEVRVRTVEFLPLGADVHTAVYKVVADDSANYFLKLRQGAFAPLTLSFPKWLSEGGIQQIIAPLETTRGQLHTRLLDFAVILYPFVAGRNGYEVALSGEQWLQLGATLRHMHTSEIPAKFRQDFQMECFSNEWREAVKQFLEQAEKEEFAEPVARETASLLRAERTRILDLVVRAENLAQILKAQTPPFFPCHADLHAGNIHVADDHAFYLVDWDTLILAPKERDLMFVGSGLMGSHYEPEAEETLFYQGYGEVEINHAALAYYRYERIVQDIAAFCEQLLSSDEGGADREQSFQYLKSNFSPAGTVELALRADKIRFPSCNIVRV